MGEMIFKKKKEADENMLKTKIIPIKPMNVRPFIPFKKETNIISFGSFGGGGNKVLPDASGLPPPTQRELENYRKNHEEIVGSIVKKSLHQHRKDVLHGSRSLQMLIPNYSRTPGDWDMYSPMEKKRALALERALDKKVGGDIAQTEHISIPKVSAGPDQPGTSKELYRIVTPSVSNDAEIDVMNRPSGLKTISKHGITHESLDEAYVKAKRRASTQPMSMAKASSDAKDIESYLKSKGKKINNPINISWL